MVRAILIEAYARRMIAAVSYERRTGVASVQRTLLEHPEGQVMEWRATLEDGVDIRLSAVVLASGPQEVPALQPSPADLEELRELGISLDDAG